MPLAASCTTAAVAVVERGRRMYRRCALSNIDYLLSCYVCYIGHGLRIAEQQIVKTEADNNDSMQRYILSAVAIDRHKLNIAMTTHCNGYIKIEKEQ